MKKFILFVIIITLYSCGPKRLGCGPRSCEISTDKKKEIVAPQKNLVKVTKRLTK